MEGVSDKEAVCAPPLQAQMAQMANARRWRAVVAANIRIERRDQMRSHPAAFTLDPLGMDACT